MIFLSQNDSLEKEFPLSETMTETQVQPEPMKLPPKEKEEDEVYIGVCCSYLEVESIVKFLGETQEEIKELLGDNDEECTFDQEDRETLHRLILQQKVATQLLADIVNKNFDLISNLKVDLGIKGNK